MRIGVARPGAGSLGSGTALLVLAGAVAAAALLVLAGAVAAAARAQAEPRLEAPSLPTRSVQTLVIAGPDADRAATPGLPSRRPKQPVRLGDGSDMTLATFLDRLMMAESGGRSDARNPRSTATGPFQFIESTWLALIAGHFADRAKGLETEAILALRTDVDLSRKAAEIYTKQNAAILVADGHKPSFTNLRLAFLLGAGGASRVLAMEPDARVAPVLGPAVVRANPFLARLTAKQLVARAARDLSVDPGADAGLKAAAIPKLPSGATAKPSGPRIVVRCNIQLPSCRRWVALKKRQLKAGGPNRIRAAARRTR